MKVHFSTKRQIIIARPLTEVYEAVANHSSWPEWLPQKVPLTQAWGLIKPGQTLECPLQGWRYGQGRVAFYFEEFGEGTLVSWSLAAALPLWRMFGKGQIKAEVAQNYEEALMHLKRFLEPSPR